MPQSALYTLSEVFLMTFLIFSLCSLGVITYSYPEIHLELKWQYSMFIAILLLVAMSTAITAVDF